MLTFQDVVQENVYGWHCCANLMDRCWYGGGYCINGDCKFAVIWWSWSHCSKGVACHAFLYRWLNWSRLKRQCIDGIGDVFSFRSVIIGNETGRQFLARHSREVFPMWWGDGEGPRRMEKGWFGMNVTEWMFLLRNQKYKNERHPSTKAPTLLKDCSSVSSINIGDVTSHKVQILSWTNKSIKIQEAFLYCQIMREGKLW